MPASPVTLYAHYINPESAFCQQKYKNYSYYSPNKSKNQEKIKWSILR